MLSTVLRAFGLRRPTMDERANTAWSTRRTVGTCGTCGGEVIADPATGTASCGVGCSTIELVPPACLRRIDSAHVRAGERPR